MTFTKRHIRDGVLIGLGLPLALVLFFICKDAYDAYRDRQRSITITGRVEVWQHEDLNLHKDANVIAVLESGSEVKVLRIQSGIDWGSVKIQMADGREGYIDALFPKSQNYTLSE